MAKQLDRTDIIKMYEGTKCTMIENQTCIIKRCPLMKCNRVEQLCKASMSPLVRIVNKPDIQIDVTSIVDRVMKNKGLLKK